MVSKRVFGSESNLCWFYSTDLVISLPNFSSIKAFELNLSKSSWQNYHWEVLLLVQEAVHELGEKNDGSIPWVKILELGRHVIHKTRQPGDLKDKWRNMKKKEASRTLNR